jgi:hypothetical protein
VLALGLSFSAAACAEPSGGASALNAAPAVTTPASATESVTPTYGLSGTDSAAASSESPRPTPALYGPDGCPVDASTLVVALRSSGSNLYSRSGRPGTLEHVTCYQGYAVGQTPNNGVSQPSWILFGYSDSRSWQPLNLGSAEYCAGYVPNDIAEHFPGCA